MFGKIEGCRSEVKQKMKKALLNRQKKTSQILLMVILSVRLLWLCPGLELVGALKREDIVLMLKNLFSLYYCHHMDFCRLILINSFHSILSCSAWHICRVGGPRHHSQRFNPSSQTHLVCIMHTAQETMICMHWYLIVVCIM